ncbi:hypothetical protein HEK131_44990 [Streptomyces seoulensis]|nr:hypothetical protein HEK131_44990 [Streptomyces seoulensis]
MGRAVSEKTPSTVLPGALVFIAGGLVPVRFSRALDDQIVTVLTDGCRPALGFIQPATRGTASTGGASIASKQQAQPDHGRCPNDDARQEERARRTSDVVAEHREGGKLVPAAGIAEHTGHAHDNCDDEDDEADDKHGILQIFTPYL